MEKVLFHNLNHRSRFLFVICMGTSLQSRYFTECCRPDFSDQFVLIQREQRVCPPNKRARLEVSERQFIPSTRVPAAERNTDLMSGLKRVVGPYCIRGCLGPEDELCWCHYVVSSQAFWLFIWYHYNIIYIIYVSDFIYNVNSENYYC